MKAQFVYSSVILLLNLEREFVKEKILSAVLSVRIKYLCGTLQRGNKAGAINFPCGRRHAMATL